MNRYVSATIVSALLIIIAVCVCTVAQVSAAYDIPQTLIDDMKLPSEGTPHGVPGYSWETSSDGGDTTTFPSGYGAIQGWGHLYEDVNGNPASNSRVQVRNFQTWWLSKSTNQWTRGQYENDFGGAAFTEDYNGSKGGDIQKIDGLPTITAGGGYNFHFWHTQDGWNVPNPADYKAIVTAFEARLVLGNAAGPDDRAQAKYLITSAIDTYVAQNNHGADGKLPNLGIGRSKYVTSNWRLYTHNTVSIVDESIIRNNPPPLVVGTDGGGGSCAKSTGDADCKNGVTLVDFMIWRDEYAGSLGTDLDGDGNPMDADFNTDTKVTLLDFQIWRNAYSSPVP